MLKGPCPWLTGRTGFRDQIHVLATAPGGGPGVWLPDTINMGFGMSVALGEVNARYDVKYHEYKLAEVKTRLRVP